MPSPVDEIIEIPFLVDTGASWTTLHTLDLLKLGSKLASLPVQRSPISLRGVGGATLQPLTTRCGVAFPHVEGGYTRFVITVALLADQASLGLPSLLGMDILSHGLLEVNPQAQTVHFDVASDLFAVPAPWERAGSPPA